MITMKTRELKFRVWNGVEWLGVDEFTLLDLEHPYKGYTFQQFTGILDEDDKEIYEGDLVEIIYGENLVAEVYFQTNMSCIRLKCNDGQSYPFVAYRFDETNKPIGVVNVAKKVIGNIFENKDLLCDHMNSHISVNGNCYNCGKLIFPKK